MTTKVIMGKTIAIHWGKEGLKDNTNSNGIDGDNGSENGKNLNGNEQCLN